MSNPFLSLIEQQLGSGNLMETLTKEIGAKDVEQTQTAASGIVTALMGAMAKNAASPQGASALANALDRDHDGSIFNDVLGILSGKSQPQNPKTVNGAGIVSHLLGEQQNGIVDMVSKMAGMDKNQVSTLMIKMAPLLMGALGKTKKEQGLDIGGLAGLLTNTMTTQKSKAQGNPMLSMVTSFLDKNGDGSIVDDLIQSAGKGLLNKLFGGKKK